MDYCRRDLRGANKIQQPGDDRADSGEEVGTMGILQPGLGGDRRQWRTTNLFAIRIHQAVVRNEDGPGTGGLGLGEIVVDGTGIGLEVLPGGELRRVDEDAGDHGTTQRAGEADQREMAFVERTHGGDEYSTFEGGKPVRRFDDLGSLHGWEVYARSFPVRGWDLGR